MLTPEQATELKAQLSRQIERLPESQRAEAQKQIDEMSSESLEIMLKQQQSSAKKDKSVFRMIISGEIPSKKVGETKEAVAVLEIHPITKGHTIIIPKKKVSPRELLPAKAFSLAKSIAKKIISKLKSGGVEIQTETKFSEQIVNVIPAYDKSVSLASPRYEAKEEELIEVQRSISTIKKASLPRIKKQVAKNTAASHYLIRRIP